MSLNSERKLVAKQYEKFSYRLGHNAILFDIYEGNLLTYVLNDLAAQLSEKSFEQAKHRVAPVNLLQRVVQKLARLYSRPPMRTVEPLTAVDLVDFYAQSFDINTVGGVANEFFNLFKSTALEPFLDANLNPRLRVVPSDRFFVFSTNPSDPMQVTHFVKTMGKQDINGVEKTVLYVYTDQEFQILDSEGNLLEGIMNEQQLDGSNPFGKIPFSYAVKSRHTLNPPIDTDTLCMTKLFPILLTDLNYAVMFQTFSILYGIDVDEEGLKMAPNAFWRFKTDPTTQHKPEIGMIKPEVDSDKVMQLIQAELSMWLQSKNIRPGSVGQLSSENFSSGISKMVDEMDTVEERQRQIPFFKQLEEDMWDLIINYMHPVWSRSQGFPVGIQFPSGTKVTVEFKEQLPMQDRNIVVDSLIKELDKGLTTRKVAIKKLNPEMSDDEVDDLLAEIEEDNSVDVTEVETPEENLVNGEQVDSEDDTNT